MADVQNIAVAGGGITGLMMAKSLADAGNQVTVFEGLNRLGGKIQTGALDGKAINLGAEFVDADNKRLIALCEELGVKLIPATDQKTEQFHLPDGKLLSGEAFHAMYKPLAEQIIKDKQNLIVDGKYTARAIVLNKMSLPQYLQELAANVPNLDPKLVETAIGVYCAEVGRTPDKVSAAQFVNESSGELGSFLNSDCGFRVEGGTQRIIDALQNYLKGKGVEFQTNAKLASVTKENGKFHLGFEGVQPEKGGQEFDKVALALTAPTLGKIEGLEALGMKPEERELLQNAQYTHSSKFFVKVKDGVEIDNTCMYSNEGFEAWTSEKGMMTFLAGGEKINEMKGTQLAVHCMEAYAKAHGKKVEDIFDTAPDKMVFGAPDTKKPCYCTPAIEQLMKLGGLFSAVERMAEQGIAFAGTFLPMRGADNNVGVGFMEAGLNSGDFAIKKLTQPARSLEHKMETSQDNMQSWVQQLFAARDNGKQAGGLLVG